MKSSLLIVFLALALAAASFLLARQGLGKATPPTAADSASIVMHNILTRTSIRSYTSDSVEAEKVDQILHAGMAAPTAANKQPWHFVTVTDTAVLKRLSEAHPYAKMIGQAPLAIVVCGDLSKALDGEAREMWIQDVSAASQNILLAAHSLNLGAVWTGVYPSSERVAAVRTALHLPDHIVPLNVIVIGYPAEHPQAKDKWKEENVSHNTFEGGTTPASKDEDEHPASAF